MPDLLTRTSPGIAAATAHWPRTPGSPRNLRPEALDGDFERPGPMDVLAPAGLTQLPFPSHRVVRPVWAVFESRRFRCDRAGRRALYVVVPGFIPITVVANDWPEGRPQREKRVSTGPAGSEEAAETIAFLGLGSASYPAGERGSVEGGRNTG